MTQMPIDPRDRPRYSAEQLQAYFKRINLPAQHLSTPVLKDRSLASTKEHGLPLLRALQLHHIATTRFENLELHYSTHRTISLNMQDLFVKFVDRGMQYGRGGRCMENNGFFGTVLRSLGYDVRNCAGRVSRAMSANAETREKQGDTYDPWNHMLNLVRIEGDWWVVDVGMGAMGPNIIYPLQDGYEAVAILPRRIRLRKRSIPEHAAQSDAEAQKLWCYDVCHNPKQVDEESHWIPTYCFTETEFLPQDYEMMSWFTSTHPKSFFTYSVMCTKMLLDEAQEQIVGDITLFNNGVRKTLHGERESVKELKTEQERVDALKDIFDVHITQEEQSAIGSDVRLG